MRNRSASMWEEQEAKTCTMAGWTLEVGDGQSGEDS